MRIIPLLALGALFVTAPAAAAPGDINAHAFYAKALALKKKGPLALLSGDIKPMKAQMTDAGTRVRSENAAAKRAGKALYCPPAEKKGAGVDFVLDGLAAIPEAKRRQMSLVTAWREILVAEYPCR